MLFVLLLLLTFIGDEQCLSCHEKQRTYFNTAHHLTSREANAASILGSFAPGKNVLATQRLLEVWPVSWPMAWAMAFPIVLVIAPLTQRLVARLVSAV